jgi:hypothetical protein
MGDDRWRNGIPKILFFSLFLGFYKVLKEKEKEEEEGFLLM